MSVQAAPHDMTADRASPWQRLLPLIAIGAGMALWYVSLPAVNASGLDDFGLISILPWTMWAAYAFVIAGFWLNLIARRFDPFVAGLSLVALIILLHGTPATVYETLRYSWAWKHLGIVDYILRNGALDPTADFLAVYHNWPGFFLAVAEGARLLGLSAIDLLDFARFFPLLLNLCFLAVLPAFYRRLTTDPRLAWSATGLFVLGNWVGQDYFSPQGTAFLLYLVALTLCLGPLANPFASGPTSVAAVRIWQRVAAWASNGVAPAASSYAPATKVFAALAVMAIIVAMTTTHQLTPMVLIAALAGLAVLNRLSFGYLAFALAAEIVWLFYFADPFFAAAFPGLVAEFGNTADSALDKMADLALVSPGQIWVSWAARGLTAAIGLAAVLGGLQRLRTGQRDGPAIVLTLAPFPLLIATSYGGEILFRLFFFALPTLGFFAAALFFPKPAQKRPWLAASAFALFAVVLVPAFILSNNGKDEQYRFTPAEVEAALWLYDTATPGSLLIEGSRSYPSQFLNYENFRYVPISEESPEERRRILADPAQILGGWLEASEGGGYVVITRSQKAGSDNLGAMPMGALDAVEDALLASPRFVVVKATADATIFALHPRSEMMGSWTQ